MAHDSSQETVMFKVQAEEVNQAREILLAVYAA
ncbi:hypothetical protein P378_05350 [Desulforamulus profundi]|uniref:Uncharacterized protein n=1 Tax=Desulforamulus profundi TaxID=1383067 RepID=A0A2C6MHB8_9FIRM|nr:hypothetical protein P378_05350 [Desulforamulus profundi]